MSTRFIFRLAPVLRHRRRTEDARAREMRRATERLESARVRQNGLERETEAARAALAVEAVTGITGSALRMRADGVRDAISRACAAAAVTTTEAARVEERRAELVEAARARRILERLEDVRRSAWHAEIRRAEQRENDDLATRRREEHL